MTTLLKKDAKWTWGKPQENAFRALKGEFTRAPVLAIADFTRPFVVECDASDFAVGAVLSQRNEKGEIHPIAFFSKAMNPAERNYDIYDKELLAIVV